MGAPIVVNTVKVQGTVTAGGTTAILGTVNINDALTIGTYDSTGTAKIMPIGGTNELTQWVPLGMNAGRLLTDTVISSGTVTSAESIPSGTLSSGTESLVPSGFVDSSTGNWTYLTLNSGSVPATVSGTVEISGNPVVSNSESVAYSSSGVGFSGSVFPMGVLTNSDTWATLRIDNNRLLVAPNTSPAYVAGTVTIPNSAPAYVAGTVTASATSPAYVAGTVTSNVGSGTRPVSVQGTANTIERGSAIAHGSAAVSASAQILAASGTRRTAVITNLGTDYVWLGASGVATGSGLRLAPGQTAVIDRAPQAAIHGVAQSGTQSVAYFTESD